MVKEIAFPVARFLKIKSSVIYSKNKKKGFSNLAKYVIVFTTYLVVLLLVEGKKRKKTCEQKENEIIKV